MLIRLKGCRHVQAIHKPGEKESRLFWGMDSNARDHEACQAFVDYLGSLKIFYRSSSVKKNYN